MVNVPPVRIAPLADGAETGDRLPTLLLTSFQYVPVSLQILSETCEKQYFGLWITLGFSLYYSQTNSLPIQLVEMLLGFQAPIVQVPAACSVSTRRESHDTLAQSCNRRRRRPGKVPRRLVLDCEHRPSRSQ